MIIPKRIIVVFALLLLISTPFYFLIFKSDLEESRGLTLGVRHHVVSPLIPSELNFAGERVPLNIPDVRERLEREMLINSFWEGNTILMMKRGARWLPYIDSILKANGVPRDFRYIPIVESRLSNEISPKGAAGFWHLMPQTAKGLGLLINDEVDERYHPGKSTEKAAIYLSKAYSKFGNWSLAAASYNRGMSGLRRAILHQKETNLYDLKLNDESTRYIFRLLAFKLLFENPKDYGFYIRESDLYAMPELEKTIVDNPTDWVRFAKKYRVTYKHIRMLNPWIQNKRFRKLSGEPIEVWFPKEAIIASDEMGNDSIFVNLKDTTSIEAWDPWDDHNFMDSIQ